MRLYHLVATIAVLALLLFPLANAELVINKHSTDFVASSPYNEQLKLCSGETKTDLVIVENTGTFPATYEVTVRSDYPGAILTLGERFTLGPKRYASLPISIGESAGITGTFAYEVVVSNEYGRVERLQRTIDVARCQTAAIEVTPASREIGLCEPTSFSVTARNVGPYAQDYTLRFGPYETIVQADREFTLEPGASLTQDVNLTFPCADYGTRVVPFDLFTEDGWGAGATGTVLVRNEYDAALTLPSTVTACAQTTTVVPIGVESLAPVGDDFRIALDGPGFASLRGERSVALQLGARGSDEIPLAIEPAPDDLGDHSIVLTLEDRYGGVTKIRELELTVERCYDPQVEMRTLAGEMIGEPVAACCGETSYIVNVRNDGTREQAFRLDVDGPAFLSLDETTVRVAPGQNVDVRLQAALPCTDETYEAAVTVSPAGQPHVNRTARLSINSQTQRTCHLVAIDDDELTVREDATVIPVIVKHLGIEGGTYAIDLGSDLFSVEESEITLQPGQQQAIHLTPRTNLSGEPKGRYILQPGFTLTSLGIPYEEHVGVELEGMGAWSRFTAWLRGLPWSGVGACGWSNLALLLLLIGLLVVLALIYSGRVTLFHDGLPRATLLIAKTLIVALLLLLIATLALLGPPTPEMTYERLADDANPTVIEWYQNAEKTLDLDQYFDDPDLDVLSYTTTQPRDMTARIDGSVLTLIPDKNFAGENTMIVTASDAKGGVTDSPVFLLRVIQKRDLGLLEIVHVWCSRLVVAFLIAALVVIWLMAIGVREERIDDPRRNVLVVVPRKKARTVRSTRKKRS